MLISFSKTSNLMERKNLIFFKTKKKIHLQQYQILKITDMMKVNSLLKLGGELAKLGCTCI
jgi:hypothetical protein